MKNLPCKSIDIYKLYSDLIETASTYNYCIDLEGINFSNIIKERYFLLKYISLLTYNIESF